MQAQESELGDQALLEVGRAQAAWEAHVLDIGGAVLGLDARLTITYFNASAEAMLDTRAEAALGRNVWDVFPDAAASEISIAVSRALGESRTVVARDFSARLEIWVEARISPIDDGLVVFLRDVTDETEARQRIQAAEAEAASLRALLDDARDAIALRRIGGLIEYWNSAAARLYGWTAEEIVGREGGELLYEELDQRNRAIEATIRDGNWSGELRHINKSGDQLLVASSWTLVRDDHGLPLMIFSISSDITEKRRRDVADLRTERMQSLGTLASGIAHDLNNVLTPILMAVQLLAFEEDDPKRLELLRSSELAVIRGSDMIQQVLSFASGATGRREPVTVLDVMSELESLRAETLPRNIDLRFDLADDLREVVGDQTQLLQVMLNLLTNARDSMPEGGTIAIRARNVDLAETFTSTAYILSPGDYIEIDVEDTGVGMSAETMSNAFEPFFSTKGAGVGTGLGLSTSLAIVRGHGGDIQVFSELGQGSTFRLLLPSAPRQTVPSDRNGPADESLPTGHGERLLVVDDDAAIRTLARRTLEAHGYTVAVASNGREAIDFIESGRAAVDLVITDMSMPVMDGAATAEYLHRRHPGIPVIGTSGLSAKGDVGVGSGSGFTSFLSKPYTTADLLLNVSAALHPNQGSRS